MVVEEETLVRDSNDSFDTKFESVGVDPWEIGDHDERNPREESKSDRRDVVEEGGLGSRVDRDGSFWTRTGWRVDRRSDKGRSCGCRNRRSSGSGRRRDRGSDRSHLNGFVDKSIAFKLINDDIFARWVFDTMVDLERCV